MKDITVPKCTLDKKRELIIFGKSDHNLAVSYFASASTALTT